MGAGGASVEQVGQVVLELVLHLTPLSQVRLHCQLDLVELVALHLEAFGLSKKQRRLAHNFAKTMPTNAANTNNFVRFGPNAATQKTPHDSGSTRRDKLGAKIPCLWGGL